MTLFNTVLVGLIIAGCIAGFFWQGSHGIIRLWQFMEGRKKQFEEKRGLSAQESQAIDLVLETCSDCRKKNFSSEADFRFFSDTLHLISQIASIYYPDEKLPVEKARIGKVLAAFLEMNQKILSMLELPGLENLTQFRLREVLPGFEAKNKNNSLQFIPTFITHRVRMMLVRMLQVQWMILVGEAAIKVYGEHHVDEVPEPETLLDEMDQLKDETDFSLPDEISGIVDASRKKILFSLKPLPWVEAKSIYILLAKNIARSWNPESSAPLYEVRIYDLLHSLAGYLEWTGNLSRKPVLNKMLGLRVSHLIRAREVTVPFTDNKFFDWAKKYQVDRAAKWSRTLLKTLQKKQPGILFRDVAMGIVKEGGKRWLILHLHAKIAEETNKLYKPHA